MCRRSTYSGGRPFRMGPMGIRYGFRTGKAAAHLLGGHTDEKKIAISFD
jgi:hypothetical protein